MEEAVNVCVNNNHQLNGNSIDNHQYYQEIIDFLNDKKFPDNSTSSEKNAIKVRAASYTLKGGELFYGRRKLRPVVRDGKRQTEILAELHVDEETGQHNGIKKMHQLLQATYFWCYSYQSITNYVQNCPVCSCTREPAPILKPKKKKSSVWSDVELHCFGPLDNAGKSGYFCVIYDPVSHWVSALPVEELNDTVVYFLLDNMCHFGFANCSIHGLEVNDFNELKAKYCQLIKDVEPNSDDQVIELGTSPSTEFTEAMKPKIDYYLQSHESSWSNRLVIARWIWTIRNDPVNKLTPMERIFGKRIQSINDQKLPKKRRKRTLAFHCDQCNDSFSSPMTLRLHQAAHSPEERLMRSTSFKRQHINDSQSSVQCSSVSEHSDNSNRISITSNTVAAVKALIKLTKEERHKRGEYHRYTQEMKDAIAQHALRHGTHDAVRVFTTSLGFHVSESSVRNFVKSYSAFSSQLKLEIGRYAAQCGIDATQKLYATKLNKPISVGLIRKFRRLYLGISTGNKTSTSSGSRRKTAPIARQLFCPSVREEIGKYAAQHGVGAAVRHFSEKLQCSVKESTVRKFKKLFGSSVMNTDQGHLHQLPPPPPPPLPPPPTTQTIQTVSEPSYYPQQPMYNNFSAQYVYQQPLNTYNGNNQQNVFTVQHPVPPYPSYNNLPPPPQYQPMGSNLPLTTYQRNWDEDCPAEIAIPVPSTDLPPVTTALPMPPLELNSPVESSDSISLKLNRSKKHRKGRLNATQRGSYATYSPELRADIGRYAAEHGSQEAVIYFKEKLGCEIPESTIRGLRDKYVLRRVNGGDEVTSLNTAQRGRPVRLGPHDEAVQECIRELIRSGEKVTTFVAMATARQVLLQREPSLLNEFGGPIKLNITWAKSFLKRMGVTRQTIQQTNSNSSA